MMATIACSSCFRALRNQSRRIGQKSGSLRHGERNFMTTPRYCAEPPKIYATPATSIPLVTPESTGGVSQGSEPLSKVASELRRATGRSAETYTAYGVTEKLFKECSKQADYSIPQALDKDSEMPKTEDGEDLGVGDGWWHTELGLKPTFSTWSQVTMLHMYLISVRFRCFPAQDSQPWQQHLLDHFFYDAENKMVLNHNMHARGTRNKYLKDMFIQWRGLLAAYDEGLVKGDAVLAAAIWRNVFKADEEVDVKNLAAIVSYMRRILQKLDIADDATITRGDIAFGSPKDEMNIVMKKSRVMDLPFTDGKVVNEPVAPSAR